MCGGTPPDLALHLIVQQQHPYDRSDRSPLPPALHALEPRNARTSSDSHAAAGGCQCSRRGSPVFETTCGPVARGGLRRFGSHRRAAPTRPGADSRAAPCGASGRAAGGAAVVLERLSPGRGDGVLRAASRPASRLVRRPEPTDATSPMRSPRRRSCRPSFRGCVRAPPRAPRVGQGVRPPAAGADAVRGPRSGQVHRGPRVPVQSRREDREPASRSLRRLDRGVAADP